MDKNQKRKIMKLERNYIFLIGVGIIGKYNYIGKILSRIIQGVKFKEKPMQFLQINYILIKIVERLIWLVIHY